MFAIQFDWSFLGKFEQKGEVPLNECTILFDSSVIFMQLSDLNQIIEVCFLLSLLTVDTTGDVADPV